MPPKISPKMTVPARLTRVNRWTKVIPEDLAAHPKSSRLMRKRRSSALISHLARTGDALQGNTCLNWPRPRPGTAPEQSLTRLLTRGEGPDHHEVQSQANRPHRPDKDRDQVPHNMQRGERLHRNRGRVA